MKYQAHIYSLHQQFFIYINQFMYIYINIHISIARKRINNFKENTRIGKFNQHFTLLRISIRFGAEPFSSKKQIHFSSKKNKYISLYSTVTNFIMSPSDLQVFTILLF